MLDPTELEAWLRLLLTPGVGRGEARRLLAAFGSPQAVFDAAAAAVRQVAGPAKAEQLARVPDDLALHLGAVTDWLLAGPDRHVLTLGDPAYPPLLLQTADPPVLLYVQGDVTALAAASVALVGSRNPTPQGADNARNFARRLAESGLVVVSGLALGIDGAAHEGALAGGGRTVAVVGTGLDRVYPRQHHALAHRIAAQGALVSEYLPGTHPLRENFPQRNRIIAGLSLGTLVVEAALQSGSLITARQALEAGREVFAIPGSIHSPQSRGTNALIRDGAKLVEVATDILDELHRPSAPSPSGPTGPAVDAASAPPGDALLEALGHDPTSLDALGARTGWPTAELQARLLTLELEGHVARLPGGLYQRREPT